MPRPNQPDHGIKWLRGVREAGGGVVAISATTGSLLRILEELGVAFYIAYPLSLFLGSGITGFLSSPYIKTNFGFVLVSPGLYLCLAGVVTLTINWDRLIRWYAEELLWLQAMWFRASWSGVGIGHLISKRRRRAAPHDGAPQ